MDPTLPVLILTDVHGCFNTMVRLLNQLTQPARVILLGDLIDRGPSSRAVVEFAMEHEIPTVIGNHCDLCLAFYNRRAHCAAHYDRGVWLDNGGDMAVRGWPAIDRRKLTGPQAAQAEYIGGRVPDEVLDWMEGLPAYIEPDAPLDSAGRRLLLSHTGYGLYADKGDWFRALWGRHALGDGPFARDPATNEEVDDGRFRVFGHTQALTAKVTDTYAMIDTGAAYGKRGYGNLTGLLWPSKELIIQPYDESPVKAAFTVAKGGCIDR